MKNFIKVTVFVVCVIIAAAASTALENETSFLWFVIRNGYLSEISSTTVRDSVISIINGFAAFALVWIAFDKIVFNETKIIDA